MKHSSVFARRLRSILTWMPAHANLDLSRFSAAPSARLSHFPFESEGAFPAQCWVGASRKQPQPPVSLARFTQERALHSRDNFKTKRATALAEWCQQCLNNGLLHKIEPLQRGLGGYHLRWQAGLVE